MWYEIKNIDELDSPSLVIYDDRVKHNIRTAIEMISDVNRLRPHVKTNKSGEATQLMMDAGIFKFKCATIAEAEMLGMCKAKNVLLAYQPVGPKLERFVALIKKYSSTKYSCLIDNTDAATKMAEVFAANEINVPVFIDLNVGQKRTGIEPAAAIKLYEDAAQMKSIMPIGLHAYDGHIRDVDFNERKRKCDDCYEKVLQLKNALIERGFDDPVIIAGGSPSFSVRSKRRDCECSPGTFIYWDKGYMDLCPEQNFLPAALVVSRIISFPGKGKICLDLGHKSIAAENELSKRVFFLNAPEFKAFSQSEEHLVVEVKEDHDYKIGDVFYGLPVHICPTVALYERAVIVVDNEVRGEWKNIARDRSISL